MDMGEREDGEPEILNSDDSSYRGGNKDDAERAKAKKQNKKAKLDDKGKSEMSDEPEQPKVRGRSQSRKESCLPVSTQPMRTVVVVDDEEVAGLVMDRERKEGNRLERLASARIGRSKSKSTSKKRKTAKRSTDVQVQPGTRRGSKNSVACLFFESVVGSSGNKYQCGLCSSVKVIGHGFSNLVSHLDKVHHDIWTKALVENQKGAVMEPYVKTLIAGRSKGGTTQQSITKYGTTREGKMEQKSVILFSLLSWMLDSQIPFNAVESAQFIRFGHEVGKELPSAYALKKGMRDFHAIVVDIARERLLKCKAFSITADMWTSMASQKYLVITYHGVALPAFERVHHVLDLVPFYGGSYGNLISSVICEKVKSHAGQSPIIMAIVTDAGSNMKKARQQVVDELGCGTASSCFAHALKGAVDAVFGEGSKKDERLELTCESVVKDFEAIKAVATVARLKADLKALFMEEDDLVLISDNKTRWEGKYLALQRWNVLADTFLKHSDTLLKYLGAEIDFDLPLDFLKKSFFRRTKRYEEMLVEFHKVSCISQSDETAATLSAIPGWIRKLQNECDMDTDLGKKLHAAVDAKLVNKFVDIDTAPMLAALLDPYAYIEMIPFVSSERQKRLWGKLIEDALRFTDTNDEVRLKFQKNSLTGAKPLLIIAMEAWVAKAKNQDPLEFWKAQESDSVTSMFYDVAAMYLSGVATSAPSERAFSSTTGSITKKRTQLGDDTLEMITVCRDWVRQPSFAQDEIVQRLISLNDDVEEAGSVEGEGDDDDDDDNDGDADEMENNDDED